jgi:hypothetical protein
MTLKEEVIELAGRVPSPPGEMLPAGVTDIEIDAFTQRTGLPVPQELREWLHFTNGPCIGPGGIYGILPRRRHLDIESVYGLYSGFKHKQWLPLGTDGCGNFFVLALNSEPTGIRPVYFVDVHQGTSHELPTYAVASELWLFLRFLFRAELGNTSWPFDASAVLANDTELASVTGAPLPWNA